MRKPMIVCLCMLFAVASSASPQCATPFPNPVIKYLGATRGNPGYIDVWLGVVNYKQYDNTLFVASPELPACGLNKNASRTWVEIDTDAGVYIYGFCALKQNTELQKLSFPWKDTTPLPKGFYITMRDRKCNRVVKSNTHFGF